MTFKSIIITAVWSGNSFYQCQLFPFVVDYCIPASLQLKKKSSHVLYESGNKLNSVQGFPSPMDYANEGVLFPEASHLSGTSPPARAPAAAARAGAGGLRWPDAHRTGATPVAQSCRQRYY